MPYFITLIIMISTTGLSQKTYTLVENLSGALEAEEHRAKPIAAKDKGEKHQPVSATIKLAALNPSQGTLAGIIGLSIKNSKVPASSNFALLLVGLSGLVYFHRRSSKGSPS